MSEVKKCPACKGAKRVLGMGAMNYIDCKECLAVGWVKKEVEDGTKEDEGKGGNEKFGEEFVKDIEQVSAEEDACEEKADKKVDNKRPRKKAAGRNKKG